LGYGLDDRVSTSGRGRKGTFPLATASRPALEPRKWESGAISPGVKQPGLEADYSPPSNAEVKKASDYASTPPIRFIGVLLG